MIALIKREVVEKYSVIPINRAGSTVIFAATDPSDLRLKGNLEIATGYKVEIVVATESSLKEAISRYYDSSGDAFKPYYNGNWRSRS